MDPLKILYVSPSAEMNNGAERCLLTLVKNLDKEQFLPVVVLPYAGLLKKELDRYGIKNVVLPVSLWAVSAPKGREVRGVMERSKMIASVIKDEKVDIVHSNTSVIVEGAIAALLTGRPHVWHLHEILKDLARMRVMLPLPMAYKFIELMSDRVVVVSRSLSAAIKGLINPEIIKLIYNGIEPDKNGIKGSIKEELGFNRNDILICTIGPIRKEKGYETFIDAANKALKTGRRNLKFISVGNSEDLRLKIELLKKVRSAKTGSHIKFLGYRDDARRILAGIDIYVVSSTTESFSLAAVEAMSAGKPIIATRCGGPEELITHDETGLLVPVNDPDAMAEAIICLSENPEKSGRMGLKCKEYSRLFKPERYVGEFEELYIKLKKRRRLDKDDERLLGLYLELLISIEEALDMRSRVFLDSFSWKVTAPVRWVIGKISRKF